MQNKINFAAFVRADIDRINEGAAWTDDQAAIFKLLLTGRLNDVGIMRELSMSGARYYKTKKEIREKIERVMTDKP